MVEGSSLTAHRKMLAPRASKKHVLWDTFALSSPTSSGDRAWFGRVIARYRSNSGQKNTRDEILRERRHVRSPLGVQVVAKRQTRRLGHGPWGCHEILFSEPELFLSEPSRGAFCEQPAGRRAKSRGACSSHRPAAGTVACRRRRALAAPKDVSRRIVTSLTKSCFPGRSRC